MDKATRDLFRSYFKELDQFLDKMPAAGPDRADSGGFHFVELDVKDTATQEDGPRNSFEITFPSSISWAMIGCLTSFAISLVMERREGTFLRLRTAPLSLGQLLAGKGLACFLSCSSVTVLLLAFATLCLGVHLGNLALLGLAILCASICFTGMMMLVSTLGKTEQSVAGAGWGIMMPLAMLGGGSIPLVFMPPWMLTASNFSPVKWCILAIEGAMWRHFTLVEMLTPCAILLAVGGVSFGIGVLWLKKQEG
jgi:ABC-2 type transport system permease protein